MYLYNRSNYSYIMDWPLLLDSPKFTFIVVKKRISSRFVTVNNGHDRQNPRPGTVVDTKVTRRNWSAYNNILIET